MSKTFKALVSGIMTDSGPIKNHLGWVFLTALLILVLVAFGPAAAVFYLALSDVDKYKALGPWADFISGTLTPILTLFTFIGVLITVVLQKIALSITQEESKRSAIAQEKQNFEATFFQMLSLHNAIVNSIDLVDPETRIRTRGRDCFRVFYTRLNKIYRKRQKRHPD